MIASRTAKHISENMEKDPAFYKKLSQMLQEVVDELHANWEMLSEAAKHAYVEKIKDLKERALSRKEPSLPANLIDEELVKAIYHDLSERVGQSAEGEVFDSPISETITDLSNAIYQAIMQNKKVDWEKRFDIQSEMKRSIDDVLYDFRKRYQMPELDEAALIEQAIELAKKNLS
jgi:type I restriction enzyme R subunit